MEATKKDDVNTGESERPVRKKIRKSEPIREDADHGTQEGKHGEPDVSSNTYARNVVVPENQKASASWSSSETMNQQKLHVPITFADRKASATNTHKLKDHSESDIDDIKSTDTSTAMSDMGTQQKGTNSSTADAPPTITTVAQPKRKKTFPGKLHELLVDGGVQETVRWLPDGDAFVILDQDKLVKEILPSYFKEAKYDSFTRKLNRWGFRRSSSNLHPDAPVYHHRLFKRDSPELCTGMTGGPKKEDHTPETLTSMVAPPLNARTGISMTDTYRRLPSRPSAGFPPSYLLQLEPPPLEQRIIEERIASSVADRIIQEERIAARAMQMHAIRSELDQRNHSLGLLHTPWGVPTVASASPLGSPLGSQYGTGGMFQDTSIGSVQPPRSLAAIAAELDARAALLRLRRQQERYNRSSRSNPY